MCMLYRGYRVRATRRWGTSKALALDFPERPASREQVRAQACVTEQYKSKQTERTALASSAEDDRMVTYNVQLSGMPART